MPNDLLMPEPAVILIADDSENDILVIRKAFERAYVPNPIYAVKSGDEVLDYLQGRGRYAVRHEYPLPDLLLLDLKMPGMDGFEVLRWIRRQPGLNSLRVVVLTSSDHIRDVNQAYQLGANSFMVKPTDFQNYVEVGKTLQTYWLKHSEAPQISRDAQPTRPEDKQSRER